MMEEKNVKREKFDIKSFFFVKKNRGHARRKNIEDGIN